VIEPGMVLRRRDRVVYRVIDDEALVLRMDDAECLGLDEVGAAVLDRVDGRRPVSGIVDQLALIYDVERAQLERDVCAFLQELVDAGVLQPAAGGG